MFLETGMQKNEQSRLMLDQKIQQINGVSRWQEKQAAEPVLWTGKAKQTPEDETCMQTQFSVQVLTLLSSLSNLQGVKDGERSGLWISQQNEGC